MKSFFTLCSLAVVVTALVLIKISQFHAMAAAGDAMVIPPETVTATPVKSESWETNLVATGSLTAVQGVTVSAEVTGKVVKIDFESGATVKEGDLLVQLDIANEEAQLRGIEASAELAKLNLQRAKDLREKGTNSQADLDAADAESKQSAAQADGIRAVIAKKTIRAPFAGRLGIRLVNQGQILREGDPICTLQTLDPIYVNFSLPQQRLAAVAAGAPVRLTSDAAPDQVFDGKINAINPDVDPSTRNFRLQAIFANSAEKLRPGMFGTLTVVLPEKQNVLSIPATAVVYAPYGDSVFVIDEKKNEKTGKMEKILRQQIVRLGNTRGDFVAVTSGLNAGDMIVTSGVFKLRPGMDVVIDNKLAPDAKLAPKPNDA